MGKVTDPLTEFVETVKARRSVINDNGRPAVQEPPGEAEQLARPRYVVRSAADALQPQPPISWVVHDLVSTGSLGVVVGPPGTKKTYALLDLGVCVALGKAWLEMGTTQARVLIIDEESGERRLARRLGDTLRGHFGDDATPLDYISLAQFNLLEPGDGALLHALVEALEPGLVIVDALVDIMPGGDENAVKDVQPVMQRLRKIAEETQAAILLIHHTNKAGSYRGSSAIAGAVDLLLSVTSESDSKFIKFEVEKHRDGEPAVFGAVATWADGQFWLSRRDVAAPGGQLSRPQRWVVEFLRQHGPSAKSEIVADPDTCSSRSASDAIYQLVEKGQIVRTNPNEKGRGIQAIYDLVTLDLIQPESTPETIQQLVYEAENDIDLGL